MYLRLIAIAICWLFASALASAAPVDDIKALLKQNKSTEAYQAGLKYPQELGNPDFDFYFGLASIDAGHVSEGILALERYLLNNPANQRARLELARAYFIMGEDVRAREEFDNVSKLNPPREVQATIDRYIDAIRSREGRYKTTSSFYLEGGAGYDDNVNSGVSDANLNLPLLGNVTVGNSGVQIDDFFFHTTAGGGITKPVAPGISVFAGARIDEKFNHKNPEFNLGATGGFGGVSLVKGKSLFRVSASLNSHTVGFTAGYDRYVDIAGAVGEWAYQVDEFQSARMLLQRANFSYAGDNSIRNSDLTGIGLGYRRVLVVNWQPVLNATLNYNQEDNRYGRRDLSRALYGGGIGLNLSPLSQWGLGLSYSYLESSYDAADPILLVTRKDTFNSLNLAATFLYNKNISVRGEWNISDNSSNLTLYDYRRRTTSVNLRYEFK